MPPLLPCILAAALATAPQGASENAVRARGWKVTLAGGLIAAAGVTFLAIGEYRLGQRPAPTGGALLLSRSFEIGGLMLTVAGALTLALSVVLWTWTDGSTTVGVSPSGVSVRWQAP